MKRCRNVIEWPYESATILKNCMISKYSGYSKLDKNCLSCSEIRWQVGQKRVKFAKMRQKLKCVSKCEVCIAPKRTSWWRNPLVSGSKLKIKLSSASMLVQLEFKNQKRKKWNLRLFSPAASGQQVVSGQTSIIIRHVLTYRDNQQEQVRCISLFMGSSLNDRCVALARFGSL